MPTINHTEDAMSSDELQALILKYGIRPVTGGSGEDESDDTDDNAGDDSTGAGSDKGDGKSGAGDGLKTALEKEREARKTAEKTLRDKAKRLAELEDAGKTEAEKLAAERDTYKESSTSYRAKYRDVHAREVVRTEALQLGADPKRVDRIVKMVRPDLAFDDGDDTPTNVKQLLSELKKTDDDLFRPVVGKGDAGAGGGNKAKTGDFMRAAFAEKR